MNEAGRKTGKVFLILYLLAVHTFAGLFIYNRFVAPYLEASKNFQAEKIGSPTEETPIPTVIPVPSFEPQNPETAENPSESAANSNQIAETNSNQTANPNVSPAISEVLMIPVAGIKREQLTDTFTASRSNGRLHDAIDIIAPQGTPVVAAANGEIAKFFESVPGGITIYQYSADKKYVYYYAHLQKRAENIKEKDYVTQGTVIGYVGDTGNAGAGNFHLHFSIALLKDPNRYWEGEYMNPFPLLKNGVEAR